MSKINVNKKILSHDFYHKRQTTQRILEVCMVNVFKIANNLNTTFTFTLAMPKNSTDDFVLLLFHLVDQETSDDSVDVEIQKDITDACLIPLQSELLCRLDSLTLSPKNSSGGTSRALSWDTRRCAYPVNDMDVPYP